VAIVVTEDPGFSGTMLERVSAVVGAMEALKHGGFTALLVPAGTEVIVRQPRRVVRPGADCCLLGLTYPRMWSGDVTGEHGRDLRAAFGGHLRVSIP
jgi:hypothetical protein